MGHLQEKEPEVHLALLVVLPSPSLVPSLFLSLPKAPLSPVARSIRSLLRPRVSLRTSPGDGVCLCACPLEGVSVCLCVCVLSYGEDGRGGGGPGRKEGKKH